MRTTEKPNILFFFTDDQRFDTIAALGNTEVKTPNIDKLVARGTAFTRAHIPSGTSGAVCMPSRAMLNTGRTLFHLDGAGESIPADHTTIGEALQAAGYRTFGTGKWHNGTESYARSFTDGGEIFFGGMSDHWNVPVFDYDPTGTYESQLPYCTDAFNSKEVRQRHATHIHCGKHSSELVCDAAIDFIADYDDEKPFYAYVSFLAPHDPRVMPKRFKDMYDPDKLELPPNFMGGHPFDNGHLRIRDEDLAGFPRTPEETREHIADYYGMISHLDNELGRVVEALDTKGVLDNTIIVFAGDNGLALGRHGLFGKQNCYDHSVRVPLILAGPGIPGGQKTDAMVYLLDIYPTLCEMVGADVPESVEGRSFVPAINDTTIGMRQTLYFGYIEMHRAVRDNTHKLIEYVVGGKHNMTQLFDLENDPWELNNLAADPDHADKLAEMRKALFRLRDEWDDKKSKWGEQFWAGYEADH